ncbi:MAG: 23S rRNA (adenine(2503)-C(2))-methyltransferase RlmN [Planctomycetota bacterium]
MTILCGLALPEFEAFAATQGWPKFRGRQISEWIFRKGAESFAAMPNLPKGLRERLPSIASIFSGAIVEDLRSKDGTRKFLLGFGDDARVECVAIPDEQRVTFCLSSQSGCPVGCAFCATGQGGFVRNLAASEIIEQFLRLKKACGRPTNVVFMGMGEPLLNLDAVVKAIEILNDDRLGAVGCRRMTLSTVGLPDLEERLRRLPIPIHLAISLHAVNDEARKRLVPHNPVGGVASLVRAAKWYLEETGREVTFEYTLLAGVNDRPSDAHALADLLAEVQSRVNLIPYNAVPGAKFASPPERDVLAFEGILRTRGLNAMIRRRRGDDVSAACGQLAFRR